jgi:hypothetical protein
MASVFLSPAYSHSFWYGDKITDNLDPNTAQALHNYLKDVIVPELWSFSGVMRPPNNNPDNQEGVTLYKPEKCWKGYTILTSMGGHLGEDSGGIFRAILIDMEGNIVNEWVGPLGSWIGRMLPGGYLLAPGPARSSGGQTRLTPARRERRPIGMAEYTFPGLTSYPFPVFRRKRERSSGNNIPL